MRRAVLPCALALGVGLTASLGSSATPAAALTAVAAEQAAARANAYAVTVTGGAGGTGGAVGSTNGPAAGGGAFSSPDPGLVSLASSTTGADAAPQAGQGTARATAEATGVSLLDGLVTVASVRAEASATVPAEGAGSSDAAASVSGVVVAGVPVEAGAGSVPVPGYGALTVGGPSAPAADDRARQSAVVALTLRLTAPFRGVPAGTEVRIGYAEAGVTAPLPSVPEPDPAPTPEPADPPVSPPPVEGAAPTPAQPAPAQPAPERPRARRPPPRRAPAAPAPRSRPTPPPSRPAPAPDAAPVPARRAPVRPRPAPRPPVATAPTPVLTPGPAVPPSPRGFPVPGPDLFDLSQSQDPPPGGFTQAPPIDPARRAVLLSDEYVFPVVGGASYSQDFGAPRAETGFHQGIDLFAPTGTPLVAVHDGTLFKVGWNHLGGRRLWLEDGHGNAFYYAHLSAYAPLARDGAQVRAGDVIGFVGDSGDAVGTPPHVHFEIHPARRWAVPPFAYVSAWRDHAVPSSVRLARSAAAPGPAGTLTPLAPQDISSVSGLDIEALLDVGVTPTP